MHQIQIIFFFVWGGLGVLRGMICVGKMFSHNPLFHGEMLQTKQVPSVSVPAVHFHLDPSLSLPHFLSCENMNLTYK